MNPHTRGSQPGPSPTNPPVRAAPNNPPPSPPRRFWRTTSPSRRSRTRCEPVHVTSVPTGQASRLATVLPLTALAMLAFAANSLLCRAALQTHSIDPASFTVIRLISGAIMLGIIASVQAGPKAALKTGSWREALALFAYAAAFSFAYVTLPAATGALILFGCVQATMISAGLVRGERLSLLQTLGALGAIGGLIYLLAPGVRAPSPVGAVLRAAAGVAWGFYPLIGRGRAGRDPTAATAGNFLRAAPLCLVLIGYAMANGFDVARSGAVLALVSGAITSGLGYAIWYA